MNRNLPRLLCAAALAATFLAALPAHAQYSWLDDKGLRVVSDRPPPSGTPLNRILKMPRGLDPRPAAAEAGAPAAPGSQAAPEQPKTASLAEREADYRVRAAKREADEKKAEQDAAAKAAKKENCEYARESERALSSGRRVWRTDANGARVPLTDEEQAHRLERSRKAVQGCP